MGSEAELKGGKYMKICLILLMLSMTPRLEAACRVLSSNGSAVQNQDDPVFQILALQSKCPINVMELRSAIASEGGKMTTAMVGNRGFHNPGQGSFSFFETVEIARPLHLRKPVAKEELFFGHFTAPGAGNTLTLDQDQIHSSLMIELIAWDSRKEMFNFYELIGSAQGSKWFYRGDSQDIWNDTKNLHLKNTAEPVFGSTLRCSGCHISGGPIMKELTAPHDSWWMKERVLPLANRIPDANVAAVMKTLHSADEFAVTVTKGLSKLTRGKAFQNKQATSPQMALRPLFCPEEINFESDSHPLGGSGVSIGVSSSFLVDPRIGSKTAVKAAKDIYVDALRKQHSRFPETNLMDADHAWLAPVKARSDLMAIASLVPNVIDQEFIADVLAIDMTRPVFSPIRCGLLPLAPAQWSPNWKREFTETLQKSRLAGAWELFENISNPSKTMGFHRGQAEQFVEKCRDRLESAEGVAELVGYLGQSRAEIAASDISKNPRGQILEPGFRVIFPVFQPAPKAWSKTLIAECHLR